MKRHFFSLLRLPVLGTVALALLWPAWVGAQRMDLSLDSWQSTALGSSTEAAAQAYAPPIAPAYAASNAPVGMASMGLSPDQQSNLASDVFGAQLFTGAFSQSGASQFNPDYVIAIGDQVQVRLWGAFAFEQTLSVDPRGNIFLPHAGPVRLLGVRNEQLQATVQAAVARTFRNNVNSYASLAAAQPVRVFVGGNVNRPGLYNGTSMDSVLRYLDMAGGVDPERGSYLQVQIKRGNFVKAQVNLYDFLLKGDMPMAQLADGDVIFVPQKNQQARVAGLVANAKRFEFQGPQSTVGQLLRYAQPQASATHVRVVRNSGLVRNAEYYALSEAQAVRVGDGDELEVTADKKPGTLTVRVEGEHNSLQEYVLPDGSTIGTVLEKIQPTARADMGSIQLYRQSVKERQKELLATSLHNLEMSLLTARSGSSDEARLRKEEAELSLQWIERAKKVEPLGQVQIAHARQRNSMLLEHGDVIRIPRRDDVVLVSGEVLFPNAVAFESGLGLNDYIARAGGFTQMADNARVVVAKRDGSYEQVTSRNLQARTAIRPGDQVLVLPKVDEKKRQYWKDMTQIMYQIAVSAKVVFGL